MSPGFPRRWPAVVYGHIAEEIPPGGWCVFGVDVDLGFVTPIYLEVLDLAAVETATGRLIAVYRNGAGIIWVSDDAALLEHVAESRRLMAPMDDQDHEN